MESLGENGRIAEMLPINSVKTFRVKNKELVKPK